MPAPFDAAFFDRAYFDTDTIVNRATRKRPANGDYDYGNPTYYPARPGGKNPSR